MARLRTIQESEDFALAAEGLGISARDLDEIMRGVVWIIARAPTEGERLVADVYMLAAGLRRNAEIIVYYTFKAEEALLLWIERVEVESL